MTAFGATKSSVQNVSSELCGELLRSKSEISHLQKTDTDVRENVSVPTEGIKKMQVLTPYWAQETLNCQQVKWSRRGLSGA